ncbi:glycosyltransferase family 4 protein [Geodermatophilus sp. URMC 64]
MRPTTSTPGAPDAPPLRVLHVVQKYASGVGSAIAQYTRSLPEAEHHLLSGTAVHAEGDLAEQGDFASTHRMLGSHLARIRRVREVVAELRPDVVHAHSSHGGGYARLAVRRGSPYLVYTPHCYSFERRDVSAAVRAGFWLAEALLALNTSAFAGCSAREVQLSAWPLRRAPRVLVPNIAPPTRPRARTRPAGPPLVVGGGRLWPQKDPEFFLRLVERLRGKLPDLRARWLGDGDTGRAALEAGGVEVSGWLPRAAVLEALGEADLYLHSARWEGFPLMVAEAAALGVPTLVRRLPSFTDVPAGLTLAGDDPAPALDCLLDADAASANVRGWADVLAHNTVPAQHAALLEVYAPARRDAHRQ